MGEGHAVHEHDRGGGQGDLATTEQDSSQEVEEGGRQSAKDDAREAPTEGVLAGLDGGHLARRRDRQQLLAVLGGAIRIGVKGPGGGCGGEGSIGEDDVGVRLDHVDRGPIAALALAQHVDELGRRIVDEVAHLAWHPDVGLRAGGLAFLDLDAHEPFAGRGVEGRLGRTLDTDDGGDRRVGQVHVDPVQRGPIEQDEAFGGRHRDQVPALDAGAGQLASVDRLLHVDGLVGVEGPGHGDHALRPDKQRPDARRILAQDGRDGVGERARVGDLCQIHFEALSSRCGNQVGCPGDHGLDHLRPLDQVEDHDPIAFSDHRQPLAGLVEGHRARRATEIAKAVSRRHGRGIVTGTDVVERLGLECPQSAGEVGDEQPMIGGVDHQRTGLGAVAEDDLGHQVAAGQVIGAHAARAGHVDPVAGPTGTRVDAVPALLDGGVARREAELRGRAHGVVAEEDDAHRHQVLGQVRVRELVDPIRRLAVLPVLEELGRGPCVVDLVEVHVVRLLDTPATQGQRRQEEEQRDADVQAVDAAGLLPDQLGAPVTTSESIAELAVEHRAQAADDAQTRIEGRYLGRCRRGGGIALVSGLGGTRRSGGQRDGSGSVLGASRAGTDLFQPRRVGHGSQGGRTHRGRSRGPRLVHGYPCGNRRIEAVEQRGASQRGLWRQRRPQHPPEQEQEDATGHDDADQEDRVAPERRSIEEVLEVQGRPERRAQDPVQADERRDAEHQRGHQVPPIEDGKQGQEGEDGEEVPLVDACRQDEEGEAEVGGRQQDGRAIAATCEQCQADQEADGQECCPDHHAGDWPEQRHRIERPAAEAGFGHRSLVAGPDQGPWVQRVDRQIWIRARGLAVLDDEARQIHAERRRDDEEEAGAHGRRRDQPPDAGLAVGPRPIPPWAGGHARSAAGLEEVASQQHHGQDRHQDDAVLWLGQAGQDGHRGGRLGVAVDEQGNGRQGQQGPECIDLAPDRRVVPGHWIEEIEGGGHEGQGRSPGTIAEPAQGQDVEQPATGDVGQDRRDLEQRRGRLDPGAAGSAQDLAQAADEPEHVHVCRWVVRQARLGVEAAGAEFDHAQGPGRERAEVRFEAGLGQQDVCDDEAEGQRGQEQDRQGRDGRRRRDRACRRSEAPIGCTRPGRRQQPAGLQERATRWRGV